MPTHLSPGTSTNALTDPWCYLCPLLSVWLTRKMTWSVPALSSTRTLFSKTTSLDVSHSRMEISPLFNRPWTILHSTLGALARCNQNLWAKFKVGPVSTQFRLEALTSVNKDCHPSVNILAIDSQHKLALSPAFLTNWVVWTNGAKSSLQAHSLKPTYRWSSFWSRDDNSRRCLLVRTRLC